MRMEVTFEAKLWKTGWRFLKELKIDLPYDPAIALSGFTPKIQMQ